MLGPAGRMLLGGGLGFALSGGVTEALLGAMMMRGMGGAATGAAGAAAATVGASLARRMWWGFGRFLRSGINLTLLGLGVSAIGAVADNWETVAARLKAIWADLNQALPTWLGGQGQGMGALTQGQGIQQLNRDISSYMRPTVEAIESWLQSTSVGRYLFQNGWISTQAQVDAQRAARRGDLVGVPATGGQAATTAPLPVTVVGRGSAAPMVVNVGPINVNVAQTNASPQAIGEAAGNAVASRMRGALYDLPAVHD